MGIDIRVPLGAMFTMLGLLLAAFGAFGNKAIYEQTLGIDVNFDWGIVLLVFGVLMLYLGLRSHPNGEISTEDGDADHRGGGH
jgi:hypothetical protein